MTNSTLVEPLTGEPPDRRESIILITGLIAIALLIRLACYTGLVGSDDLLYAHHAHQISDGTYRLVPEHHGLRFGIIAPVALVYKLFGFHEWTTVVLPLLFSSLAVAMTAMIALRLSGLYSAWVAGLFMATFPLEVRFASSLVPEPFLQITMLAGVLLFLLAERRNSGAFGLAAGAFFALAYLTKEPGALAAAAFFAFALLRRRWQLALSLLAGGALVVAVEMAWYWSQSGDPLYRLHAMDIHNTRAMKIEANQDRAYRLWKAYPAQMLVPSIQFGLHSLVALGLSAIALLRWKSSKAVWLLLLWASLPFLYLNFGTSSFSSYVLLPVQGRYLSLIYPPLFVVAAMALSGWVRGHQQRRWLAGVTVAITCAVGIYCAAVTRGTGNNVAQIRRLKEIVAVARRQNGQICEITGRDKGRWSMALDMIAPDRLGCSTRTLLQLLPDSSGLPTSKQMSVNTP